ncbi:uncharacterized protein EI90DRAFT_3115050 [Cantharellus anzutake]|uniref:uncharacterized protein n=1 Tax=Cantharellus anzutake TaxID=1750568 RepID=UPI001903BB33|nr:uncharacterized protein EI90DRAFT_3115050 [Cantharellus anzutake]KAF8344295.1 hypothetical protein EI90DRAFT_3115050 [Cantharellus anzutake]
MLIDTGSELNIMTSEQAYALELPVDPTGAMWTLRGVSGHQVALEGLCRDVPVTIGGIEVTHNFFLTRDTLHGKDMILGQPWLFGHSTKIEYMHDVGMVIQVWNEGNRDSGASVRIKLPIMNAPRNVYPVQARRYARAAATTYDISTVRSGSDPQTSEPPQFPSCIPSTFTMPQTELKELRPDGLDHVLANRNMEDLEVLKALKNAWIPSKAPHSLGFTDYTEQMECFPFPMHDSSLIYTSNCPEPATRVTSLTALPEQKLKEPRPDGLDYVLEGREAAHAEDSRAATGPLALSGLDSTGIVEHVDIAKGMAAAQEFPCMHHEPVVAESSPVIAQNSETGCTVVKPGSTGAAMIARIAPKSFTGLEICFLANFLTAQEKPVVHAKVTEVTHPPESRERSSGSHEDYLCRSQELSSNSYDNRVGNSDLEFPPSQLRWLGPHMVDKRLRSGALVLQELDGEESIIREPVKLSEGYEEPDNEANYASYATKPRHLTPPKPWELKGEKLAEYWREKYERMRARTENPDLRFHPSQRGYELERFIDEDTRFRDFRHATQLKEDVDLKTLPPGPPDLFYWLSWGGKDSYILQNSYSTRSDPEHKLEVKLLLGGPTIEVIHSDKSPMLVAAPTTETSGPTNGKTPLKITQCEINHHPLPPFECSMGYGNPNAPHTRRRRSRGRYRHRPPEPSHERLQEGRRASRRSPIWQQETDSERAICELQAKLDQSMALVDNKTAPRRTALPFLGSTPVAPPVQKVAPPADSLTRPSEMPVAIVPAPKISLARDFTEKTNEWTHRVRDIDKDSVKKFVGTTPEFQPPAVIPRDPKDAPADVEPVLKSPSPMDEHPKAEQDVKGQARAHNEEDSASRKTSVSRRSSSQESAAPSS